MSLRLRLLLILAPLFVIGLVIADVATYTSLQSFLVSRVDDQLLGTHHNVEDQLLNQLFARRGGPGGAPDNPFGSLPAGTCSELFGTDGSLVAGPTSFAPGQLPSPCTSFPKLPDSLAAGTDQHPDLRTVSGSGSFDSYRVLVQQSDHVQNGVLVVAAPLDEVSSTLRRLTLLELGVTGGVTLIVLVITWLTVRRALRPLERMGATARSIVAETDLSRRVTPSSDRTEVGRLGLALNTMLAQLEGAFAERAANEQRLRHFISDASHELRTPLTSMQGYAELIQRNAEMTREDMELALRRMEEETRRMGLLVDDLLLLARLDQGRPLESSSVDLEALVSDAGADARAADPERSVSERIAAPLVVNGDDMRLRQVLGNVVRNALVHTPPGTPVEIELRPEDGHAVIEVVDHGNGIPPGHAERIFERFHRAEPGRSGDQGGSGLGLSIAAAVVAAHRGRITVRDTPGGGATFRIELPLPNGSAPPAAAAMPLVMDGSDQQVSGDPGESATPA
jgi:two-component system OmpR family sensor kinase